MHQLVDRWTQMLRWPIAGLATFGLPFLLWASLLLAQRALLDPLPACAFGGGIVLFVFVWRTYLRSRTIGPWLMQIEHEATHLLFAFLTGHPITGWTREARQGTHVQFVGQGNWLIQIAPYFFPTAAFVLWILTLIIVPLGSFALTRTIALGIATGFHVLSTVREIRRDQAELQSLSWKFCWMFLPAANLLTLGLLIAFSYHGFPGMAQFLQETIQPIVWLFRRPFLAD